MRFKALAHIPLMTSKARSILHMMVEIQLQGFVSHKPTYQKVMWRDSDFQW